VDSGWFAVRARQAMAGTSGWVSPARVWRPRWRTAA